MNLSHLNQRFSFKPSKINNGYCFIWALYAREHNPFAQLYSYKDNGCHAFVKIGNKYFDAEAPNGVSDWRQLPFFKEYVKDSNSKFAVKEDIYNFCKYWNRIGYGKLPKQFVKYCA